MSSRENFSHMVDNLLSIGGGKWNRSMVEKALEESQCDADVAFDRLSRLGGGSADSATVHPTGDPIMAEIEKVCRVPPPSLQKKTPASGHCAAVAAASRPPTPNSYSEDNRNARIDGRRRPQQYVSRPPGELDALQYLIDQPVALPSNLRNIRENPSYLNLKKSFFKDPSKLGIAIAEIYQKDPNFYSILKDNLQQIVACLHEPIVIDSADNLDDIFSSSNIVVEKTTTTATKKSVSQQQQDTSSDATFGGSWTQEDDKKLEQLVSMGFDAAKGRSAYIQCNRDISKAIERLCMN